MYYLIKYGLKGGRLSHEVVDENSLIEAKSVAMAKAIGVYDDKFGEEEPPLTLGDSEEEVDNAIDERLSQRTDKIYFDAEEYDSKKHGKYKLNGNRDHSDIDEEDYL